MVANSDIVGLPQGQTVRTLQLGEDQVSVEDAELLFRGDYSREGGDLVISYGGRSFVITEYFNTENPPDLVTSKGAVFTPDTVSSLAGPASPGQYAQADGGGDLIEIGTVQSLTGTAYRTQGNGIKTELAEGDPVYQGDLIETGPDSKLGIAFVDKTVFSVSANARMVLDELIYDPNESENNSMVFNLIEGGFVFLTGEIAPSGNMEMNTPSGTMGIRGTMPTAYIDPGNGTQQYAVSVEPDGTSGSYILTIGDKTFVVEDTGTKWVVDGNNVAVIDKLTFDYILEEEEREFLEIVLNAINDRSELEGGPTYNRIDFETPSGTAVNIDAGPPADDGFAFTPVGADQNGADKDDPPVTFPDFYTIDEDTDLTGANVIAGSGGGADYDPDGYTIRVIEVNGQPLTFINGVATVQLPPSQDVIDNSGGSTGAVLLITENGNITYQVGGVYQYLAIDESATDSFTYTVQDKNGFTTTETVTITIEGNNDSPDIIVDTGVGDSASEGLNETNDPLTVSGTLSLADVDITDVVQAEVLDVTIDPASTGPAGSHPDLAVLKAMMTLEQSTIIDGDETTGQIVWTFDSEDSSDPTQEPFDYLANGETLILDYVVFQALDDSGSDGSGNDEVPFDEQIVTITITGTNDQPLIDSITSAGALTEVAGDSYGALPNAQGEIEISDPDDTDTVTLTEIYNDDMVWNSDTGSVNVDVVNGNSTVPNQLSATEIQALIDGFVLNNPGPLAIDDTTNTVDSSWIYSTGVDLNFLAEGETLVFSYEVTVTDDSGVGDNPALGEKDSDTKTVTITITGTNDVPVLEVAQSDLSADLTEVALNADGATATTPGDAGGTITISDLDDTDTVTLSESYDGNMVWSGGPITTDQLSQTQIDALIDGFVLTDVDAPNSNNGGTNGSDSVTTALAIDDGTNDVTTNWTYTTTEDLNFLADGETITFSYTVTPTDDSGTGTAVGTEQTVTVTLRGTNDVPILEVAQSDLSADLTEVALNADGAAATTPGDAGGTITISDLDDTDTVTLSESYDGNMVWSGGPITTDQLSQTQIDALIDGFVLTDVDAPNSNNGGTNGSDSVTTALAIDDGTNDVTTDWTYSTTEDLNFLAEGETITFSYTVTPTDDSGTGTAIGTEQTVTVTLRGTNDVPVLEVAQSDLSADLTEVIGNGSGASETSTGDAAGTIVISDLDDTDTVTLSESYKGDISWDGGDITNHLSQAEIDALIDGFVLTNTDVASSNTLGDGDADSDSVTTALAIDDTNNNVTTDWTYSTNVDLNFLGAGETITLSYTVTPTDDSSTGTAVGTPQTVTITIRGTNDTPDVTVLAGEDSGSVAEDIDVVADNPNTGATESGEFLTDTGTISFADLDTNDTSDASIALKANGIVYNGASSDAALDAALVNAMVIDGAIDDANGGDIDWNFAIDNSLTQFLADGESVTVTYVITIQDDSGAGAGNAVNEADTVTQEITVTIYGNNDTPDITVAALEDAGAVVEDVNPVPDNPNTTPTVENDEYLTDDGSISFADVDVTDTSDTTIALKAGSISYGGDATTNATLESALADADTMVVTGDTEDANSGNVAWSFALDNSLTQFLGNGDSVTVTYTITVVDDSDSSADAGGGADEPDTATKDVTVTITGVNDEVVITSAVDTGAVTEDMAAPQTATGTVEFTDADFSDDHAVTSARNAKPTDYGKDMGTFVVVETTDTTGSGAGGVATWTYTLTNGAAQELANGQQVTETYTISINDQNGDTATQDVVITITGVNDDVMVEGTPVLSGGVEEDVTAQATGTIGFSDVDLTDDHLVTEALKSTDYTESMGTFSVVETTDTTNSGTGGVATWTYDIDNDAAQELAAGQVVTEIYTVSINDQNGHTLTQDVTITITGTNDAPVIDTITKKDLTEQTDTSTLTTDIDVTFGDVDLSDTSHTAAISAVSAAGATTGLTLSNQDLMDLITPGTVTKVAGTDNGSVTLAFSAASTAFDYLAEDQVVTLTYTTDIDDQNTDGLSQQTFVVTITGTNDAPEAVADTAATDENASLVISEESLLSNDKDVDNGAILSVTGVSSTSGAGASLALVQVADQAPVVLMDPTTNDGSFESNVPPTGSNGVNLGPVTLPTWDIVSTGGGGVLTSPPHSTTLAGSEGQDALFADGGARTTATSTNLLGGTYTTVSEGDVIEWSFTVDGWNENATGTLSLSFGGTIVEIGSGVSGDADLTSFTTISGTYVVTAADAANAAGGELKAVLDVQGFAGTGSSVQNAYLDDVRLTVTPATPEIVYDPGTEFDHLADGDTAQDTFTYTVTDEKGATDSETVTVTVTGVNDAPEVSVASALEYFDGDGAVRIDDGISVTDVDDGAMIHGATVTISSGYESGEDVLNFVAQGNITGSFVDGILTLSGTDTVEQYEAALQSVVFSSGGEGISTGVRQIDFVVNDGTDDSAVASNTVTVAGRNLVDLNVSPSADGTAQADLILGTDDPNTINGGGGSDRIIAGLGSNMISGGAGKDIFVLDDFEVDHILDYTEGEDVIDLDALLAGATDASNVTAQEVSDSGEDYTSLRVGGTEVARLTDVSAGEELSVVYNSAEAAAQVTVAAATMT